MSTFFKSVTLSLLLTASFSAVASAQETESTSDAPSAETNIDEIIVEGRRQWEGHDGMEAFWAGDFEKAEIEFEGEFKSLRRQDRARLNAIDDAALGAERIDMQMAAGADTGGSSTPGGVFVPESAPADPGSAGRFRNRKVKGRNLLNDGKLTDADFGFTKYMAGLSEIQLGKYDEAKKSFKRSIHFDETNYDARLRLGLLYVMESDFEKAAHQLEKIENQRQKCKKRNCDYYKSIEEAALTLAKGITKTVNKQQ